MLKREALVMEGVGGMGWRQKLHLFSAWLLEALRTFPFIRPPFCRVSPSLDFLQFCVFGGGGGEGAVIPSNTASWTDFQFRVRCSKHLTSE